MIKPYQMNKGNLNPLNGDEIVLQNYALNAASNVFGLNGTVVRSTLPCESRQHNTPIRLCAAIKSQK